MQKTLLWLLTVWQPKAVQVIKFYTVQVCGHTSAKTVARERQIPQVVEVAQFGRDRPAQLQRCKVGEIAKSRRDGAAQLISVQPQSCQVGETVQCGRNRAVQLVEKKVQMGQTAEDAKFGENRPVQTVVFKEHLSDTAVFVGTHSIPVLERLVAQLGLVDVCLNRDLQDHNVVYPRRAAKGREETLLWST